MQERTSGDQRSRDMVTRSSHEMFDPSGLAHVMFVDDHVIRQGLRSVLESSTGCGGYWRQINLGGTRYVSNSSERPAIDTRMLKIPANMLALTHIVREDFYCNRRYENQNSLRYSFFAPGLYKGRSTSQAR